MKANVWLSLTRTHKQKHLCRLSNWTANHCLTSSHGIIAACSVVTDGTYFPINVGLVLFGGCLSAPRSNVDMDTPIQGLLPALVGVSLKGHCCTSQHRLFLLDMFPVRVGDGLSSLFGGVFLLPSRRPEVLLPCVFLVLLDVPNMFPALVGDSFCSCFGGAVLGHHCYSQMPLLLNVFSGELGGLCWTLQTLTHSLHPRCPCRVF